MGDDSDDGVGRRAAIGPVSTEAFWKTHSAKSAYILNRSYFNQTPSLAAVVAHN